MKKATHDIVEELRKKVKEFSLITRCHRCGEYGAERRKQQTSYPDEEANWDTLCSFCQEEADEYWSDMWADYHSQIM